MPVLGVMILLTDHTTLYLLRRAPAQSNLPFQAMRYASPLTMHELQVRNPLALPVEQDHALDHVQLLVLGAAMADVGLPRLAVFIFIILC